MKYKRAAVDCETDPFLYGRKPVPFAWDFFDGETHHTFWSNPYGSSATEQFLSFLDKLSGSFELYAHNGGKFDWMFLIDDFRGQIRTINNRIVTAFRGRHKFRDSYANMPVALKAFKPANGVRKKSIDMALLERDKRENNRREIIDYLKADTETLFAAVEAWHEQFGEGLTMAGAAQKELSLTLTGSKRDRGFDTLSRQQDEQWRRFFHGGRVQAFEKGVIKEDLKYYDFNSAYPAAMRNHPHPIGKVYEYSKNITELTDFAEIEAWSDGALPVRTRDGLEFPKGEGTFFATGHEIRAAMKLNRLRIKSVRMAYTCTRRVNFRVFIDKFWTLRQAAKADNDEMGSLFYKLVMNSAYGRFALNPAKFTDEHICEPGQKPSGEGWQIKATLGRSTIWSRPAPRADTQYLNVATAASITGATRASLMYALALSERPLYCDTDAVICRDMDPSVGLGASLGEMKLEAEGYKMAIAGKKMYAFWPNEGKPKVASKGARLTADQIELVASGSTITYLQDAPTMSMTGRTVFMARDVRSTLLNPEAF